jgi:cyclopropane fatty-acyl-phospholipid synthase-like methyltransferase
MILSEKRKTDEKWFYSDEQFNQLYPLDIRTLSARHWTPLQVARVAAGFLATEKQAKILDIGSGVGKFCLSAAHFYPQATFYGVEQRRYLIKHAETAGKILGFKNVSFIHGNFTQIDLKNFDHFYFFNSFYENLTGTDKIDEDILYSAELFNYYNRFLYKQLEKMPAGTRLVTFHSLEDEIPDCYQVVDVQMSNMLKFRIKV